MLDLSFPNNEQMFLVFVFDYRIIDAAKDKCRLLFTLIDGDNNRRTIFFLKF